MTFFLWSFDILLLNLTIIFNLHFSSHRRVFYSYTVLDTTILEYLDIYMWELFQMCTGWFKKEKLNSKWTISCRFCQKSGIAYSIWNGIKIQIFVINRHEQRWVSCSIITSDITRHAKIWLGEMTYESHIHTEGLYQKSSYSLQIFKKETYAKQL